MHTSGTDEPGENSTGMMSHAASHASPRLARFSSVYG